LISVQDFSVLYMLFMFGKSVWTSIPADQLYLE
jgi:hypothetical protein